MSEEISTKELEYLLNNYWVVKENEPKLYFDIKNKLDNYKEFIRDKLGSKLIVSDRFIKLEKIPSIPKAYMGLNGFGDKLEYIILCIVLIFLEDKPKLEQFILSNLIDFLSNTAVTLELDTVPDWNILHHRKCLANVIKYLSNLNVIRIVEEKDSFTESKEAEGLYETTGISNYMVREFKKDVIDYCSLEDFMQDEFNNQDDDLGIIKRYHVYRHLVYGAATYTEDLTDYELDYLRRFRGIISSDISRYINADLELTKNMGIILFEEDTREKLYFPNNKAISDIVLLVNAKILSRIDNEEFILDENETLNLSKEDFERIIKEVRSENIKYFSKYYRTLPIDKLIKEIVNFMQEYDFLRKDNFNYKLYPAISKFTGYFPKDTNEQIDLFIDESSDEDE